MTWLMAYHPAKSVRPQHSRSDELSYEVDLSELEVRDVERSTWDSRALLAFEMSKLREVFSKQEIDVVTEQAATMGMAFTQRRAYVVTFDGQNFTLSRNTLSTRLFFRLDSFLRRLV